MTCAAMTARYSLPRSPMADDYQAPNSVVIEVTNVLALIAWQARSLYLISPPTASYFDPISSRLAHIFALLAFILYLPFHRTRTFLVYASDRPVASFRLTPSTEIATLALLLPPSKSTYLAVLNSLLTISAREKRPCFVARTLDDSPIGKRLHKLGASRDPRYLAHVNTYKYGPLRFTLLRHLSHST